MYWLFRPTASSYAVDLETGGSSDEDATTSDWQLSPLKKKPTTSTLLQRKRIKSSAGVDN